MKGEVVAGRYELEDLCGAGGMSSVWRAHDRLLDRKVALKILDERYGEDAEYVERFRREARAVARLSHPNIVTVIDRGQEDGRQFIVFEFVDGENLKKVVEREGPLPVRRVLELGLEIARGLQFAHEHGLVHRDVKPQNVILNGAGRAKVTDFGIARSLDVEKGFTQTGTVLGTSNYIAPEQASGERIDARSDVYSLGCVLFELLAGDVPFPGDNFVVVAMRHLNEPPPRVLERRPDAPPRLAAAIERALEKDARDRIGMEELLAQLEACLEELERVPGAEPTVVMRRPRQHVRPRAVPWPLALALLGVALVVAAVVAILLSGGEGGTAAPGKKRVQLAAISSYDPFGNDRSEHEGQVANATDGRPDTYWTTSSYRFGNGSLGKPGVGIVVTASAAAELKAVQLVTDTPGFRAEIRVGNRRVSPSRTIGPTTELPIEEGTKALRYLVWITNLGSASSAHVNEVRGLPASG